MFTAEGNPRWGIIAIVAVCAFIALSVIGGVVKFACGYGNEAGRVVGVENVKEQNTKIIEDYEALKATAANACAAKNSEKQEGDPTLVEDPAFAYGAKYREIAVDYNRRFANLYEARAVRGLPLPHNLREYPKVAPTLKEMQAEVC